MSTHSTISLLSKDNKVSTIYCHNDGYLSSNGFILYNYYQNIDIVKEMISLGGMSSLRIKIASDDGQANSNNRDVSIFYARDRGEELTINHYDSFDEYLHSEKEGYDYLFKEANNTWYSVNVLNVDKPLKPLYGELVSALKEVTNSQSKLTQTLQTKSDFAKIKLAKKLEKNLPKSSAVKRLKI